MSNFTEMQRIVKENIADTIWDYKEKMGWLNRCIFDDADSDPHTLAVKLGNSMEPIFTELARLRYPSNLLPRTIAGHGVTDQEAKDYWTEKYVNNNAMSRKNGIIILTRLNEVQLSTQLTQEFSLRFPKRKRKAKNRFDQKSLEVLSERLLNTIERQQDIHEVCVDLCPCIDGVWTVMEIKLGGDLDKQKKSDVINESILAPYVALGNKPKKAFFGVITDNKGVSKAGYWKGQIGGYLMPEMILLEENLFKMVAPTDISFDDFKQTVCQRIENLRP